MTPSARRQRHLINRKKIQIKFNEPIETTKITGGSTIIESDTIDTNP